MAPLERMSRHSAVFIILLAMATRLAARVVSKFRNFNRAVSETGTAPTLKNAVKITSCLVAGTGWAALQTLFIDRYLDAVYLYQ